MALSLHVGVASDAGEFRDVNQDAAFAAPWGAGVADGVGGGPAGDLASAALIHRLVAAAGPVADAAALAVRIRSANWDLGAHVRRNPELSGMATTFTAIWLTESDGLLLAHTGDSRAYVQRGGQLVRQTRDDSFVQALVEQGIVREEDAIMHPRRNLITASFRGEPTDLVRVTERVPVRADRWMICSDGVSDYLPDDVIAELVRGIDDPDMCARALVTAALEAGSRDNVTSVIADVMDVPPAARRVSFAGAAAARFREEIDLVG